MFNFQRGDQSPVVFQPLGFAAVVLNVKEHNVDISVLLFDVTGTASGGLTSRMAGKFDAAGTVQADLDLDAPPYAAPIFILPGQRGVMLFFLGPIKAIQVPVIIEKVHYQAAVESEVKYSFDVKMDSRSGLLVFPAA